MLVERAFVLSLFLRKNKNNCYSFKAWRSIYNTTAYTCSLNYKKLKNYLLKKA